MRRATAVGETVAGTAYVFGNEIGARTKSIKEGITGSRKTHGYATAKTSKSCRRMKCSGRSRCDSPSNNWRNVVQSWCRPKLSARITCSNAMLD